MSFDNRVQEQHFAYDWLGNTQQTQDDGQGFFDRSLGEIQDGAADDGPHQLRSASNRALAPGSSRKGDLDAAYDAAGNLTDLVVRRDGSCLPQGASCWQRFHYEWDEVGQLAGARRWDLSGDERLANAETDSPVPDREPDAELRYAYKASGSRVLKTAVDQNGVTRHTVYVFPSLELRSTEWDDSSATPDYVLNANTESVRLIGGGVVARVIYSEEDLPSLTSGRQHLFLELADHLGSTTFIIDHATGELVEYSTYQAYGAAESDYRPGRWASFREPYKFSGKEDDIELGLAYFGARYYSPYLGRWLSPDPATIHDLSSDANPYAYVRGSPLMAVDPNGEFLAFLLAVGIGAAIGAVIGGGTSIAVQLATTGEVNWGAVGKMALVGAVGGAVSGGIGFLGSGVANAVAAGTLSGAASYGTGVGLKMYEFSGWGFVGAIVGGGVAGGIGAWIGQTGETFWHSLAAATGGSSAGYTTSALIGGQGLSWEGFALCLGASAAGALANLGAAGLRDLISGSPVDDPTVRAAMKEAMRRSNPDDYDPRHEEQFFYGKEEDGSRGVRWLEPGTRKTHKAPDVAEMGNKYEGLQVEGHAHTHPNPSVDEAGTHWDEGPSYAMQEGVPVKDVGVTMRRGTPGDDYVVGRTSVYKITSDGDVTRLGPLTTVLSNWNASPVWLPAVVATQAPIDAITWWCANADSCPGKLGGRGR